MVWARLDENFPDHPKVIGLSDCTFRLFVASLCYASRTLSDGAIPKAALARLGGSSRAAVQLVEAGLWEETATGYEVHDFLLYNPSREEVLGSRAARSEARALAGKAGGSEAKRRAGIASGVARRTANEQQTNSKRTANAEHFAVQREQQTNNPVPSRPVPLEAAAAREVADETEEAVGRLCREWERATGTTVTAMLGETFATWLNTVSEEWVADAIRETGAAGAKSTKYLKAILERWQLDGRDTDRGAPAKRAPEPVKDGSWLKQHVVPPRATPEELARGEAEYEANREARKAEMAALGVIE